MCVRACARMCLYLLVVDSTEWVIHNLQTILKYQILLYCSQLILTECFCWFLLNSCIYSQPMIVIQLWFLKIRLQINSWLLLDLVKELLITFMNTCGSNMNVVDVFLLTVTTKMKEKQWNHVLELQVIPQWLEWLLYWTGESFSNPGGILSQMYEFS